MRHPNRTIAFLLLALAILFLSGCHPLTPRAKADVPPRTFDLYWSSGTAAIHISSDSVITNTDGSVTAIVSHVFKGWDVVEPGDTITIHQGFVVADHRRTPESTHGSTSP